MPLDPPAPPLLPLTPHDVEGIIDPERARRLTEFARHYYDTPPADISQLAYEGMIVSIDLKAEVRAQIAKRQEAEEANTINGRALRIVSQELEAERQRRETAERELLVIRAGIDNIADEVRALVADVKRARRST